MIRTTLVIALGASLIAGAPASAQTAPAAPAKPQLGGPIIPGLCVLSRDAMFANAKVGLAAEARLKVLAEQAQAEVDRERGPIEAEAKALEDLAKTQKPEQLKARRDALAGKLQALQQKAAVRSREIELTRRKAADRITLLAEPVVADVYKARNCGALFSREAMIGSNPAMDITAATVAALDAKVSTITFEREALPAQPVAAR